MDLISLSFVGGGNRLHYIPGNVQRLHHLDLMIAFWSLVEAIVVMMIMAVVVVVVNDDCGVGGGNCGDDDYGGGGGE